MLLYESIPNESAEITFEQIFAIPGNAQAKIEDVSRVLLNHVSQMPGKAIIQQVTTGSGQPFADIGKKLAVRILVCFVSG